MKITKEIIADLLPLYEANECSADSRALIDEYLRDNPGEAVQIRRLMNVGVPAAMPSAALDEAQSFREARRRIRRRSWILGLAIFFSLAPFSFVIGVGKSWWMLRDAPQSAIAYVLMAVVAWIFLAIDRSRSRSL